MIRHSRLVRAIVAMLLAGVSAAGVAAEATAPASEGGARNTDSVWCADEKLSIVQRQVRWRCEGSVVSNEEAQRIKQARVDRIKRVLQREQEPLLPGRKLIGTGTGFFVSGAGQVLTNHHVVKRCEAITVSPAGGTERVVTLAGVDPQYDLALLQTGRSSPGSAMFRAFDEIIANEPVTIVGYPLHGKVVIKPLLVSGNVDVRAQPSNPNVFAMKVDIRRGNSGGPVLDQAGRVMGVVFAKIDTPKVYEKTGKLVRDVGLAIRLPVIRDFLQRNAVDITESSTNTALEHNTRATRAHQFIAQIRCWQ